MTDELVTFLRARLNEDARAAEEAGDSWYEYRPDQRIDSISKADNRHITTHNPFRVLTDVDAKKRIIEQANLYLCDSGPGRGYRTKHGHAVLCLLAMPYRHHPDYRDEWRP